MVLPNWLFQGDQNFQLPVTLLRWTHPTNYMEKLMFSGSIHWGCLQNHSSEMCGSLIADSFIPLPLQPAWQSVPILLWVTGGLGSFSCPTWMNQMVKPGHLFAEVFPHQPYWKCQETPVNGSLLMPNTKTVHFCSQEPARSLLVGKQTEL